MPSSRSSNSSPAERSAASICSSGCQYLRSEASSRRLATLAEAVGFKLGQARAHCRIQDESLGDLLIHPGLHFAGRGGPAHGVGDVRLDLPHALVAVLEHALVPLRIEGARARLERNLLRQGAHRARAARMVRDVNRCRLAALGAPHRAIDAAERIEIRVHRGYAELHRIQILVGQLHVGENARQQLGLLHRAARAPIGKAFAPRVGFGELVFLSHRPFSIKWLTLDP